jgi:hypothetical protein
LVVVQDWETAVEEEEEEEKEEEEEEEEVAVAGLRRNPYRQRSRKAEAAWPGAKPAAGKTQRT